MATMNPYNGFGFQRPSFGGMIRGFFRQNSVLGVLIVINLGLWITLLFSKIPVRMMNREETQNLLVEYLALFPDWSIFLKRPWTAITYMFLHERFWHLFFNLWMLWFGGSIFARMQPQKHLAWIYGFGGLIGAAFVVMAYNLLPFLKTTEMVEPVMGASASALAIMIAAAAYSPDYEIRLFLFSRMKFVWVALVFVAIDLLSITGENPGGHIAHLGGALFGFVYGFLLRKSAKTRKERPKKKRKPKVEYTPYKEIKDEPQMPRSDEEYNRQKAERERDVDAILDKIAKNGYASLTPEEKEFLFKNSK